MASTSNWIIIGALALLVAIGILYFTTGPADISTSGTAVAPVVQEPVAETAPAATPVTE